MCLLTRQQEPFIAEEDMIVYKVMHKDLTSLYEFFPYKFGKLYETDITKDGEMCPVDVEESDYWDSIYGEDKWRHEEIEELVSLEKGFHFFETIERCLKAWKTEAIFECIVPKGSEWYSSGNNIGVSNKIIIKNELPDNQR